MRNCKRLIPCMVAAAAAWGATSAAFAYEAGDWIVRGGSATISPDSDSDQVMLDGAPLTSGGGNVDVSEETGIGLSATYMFTPALGLELLASTPFEHDLEADGELATFMFSQGFTNKDIGTGTHLPPTLSLQWYVAPNSGTNWELYLGLGVNYTMFLDEDLSGQVEQGLQASDLSLDDSVGVAASIGLDWRIDENWLLNLGVMYADIQTDAEFKAMGGASKVEVDGVDIDPWIYRLNVGYKF